jgi:hypothetical protein
MYLSCVRPTDSAGEDTQLIQVLIKGEGEGTGLANENVYLLYLVFGIPFTLPMLVSSTHACLVYLLYLMHTLYFSIDACLVYLL